MSRFWTCFTAVALACLLLIAVPLRYNAGSEERLKSEFDEYVRMYNKSYRNEPGEYERRFRNFQESMAEIQLLNAASRGPEGHRARFGPTHLSDMSKSEFTLVHLSDEKASRQHGHSRRIEKDPESNEIPLSRKRRAIVTAPLSGNVPTKFDWRIKGYIGSIKNQGICGACWAFATVGTIETMAAIKTGKFEPLSVQEMIDCAGYGNKGCGGGDICLLLEWLRFTGAVVQRENSYPLTGVDAACRLNKNSSGVHVASANCDSLVGLEDEIISNLATHGPVAVAVNALTWQNYVSGVIQYHCGGSVQELNHAVQIVGYDLTADVPYYIVRNSWGPEFGEDGYLRLAVGSNMCGLANEVASIDVTV